MPQRIPAIFWVTSLDEVGGKFQVMPGALDPRRTAFANGTTRSRPAMLEKNLLTSQKSQNPSNRPVLIIQSPRHWLIQSRLNLTPRLSQKQHDRSVLLNASLSWQLHVQVNNKEAQSPQKRISTQPTSSFPCRARHTPTRCLFFPWLPRRQRETRTHGHSCCCELNLDRAAEERGFFPRLTRKHLMLHGTAHLGHPATLQKMGLEF